MTAPNFGYDSSRPNDEIIPVAGGDFSTVGLCSTSPDADNTVFPYDEPIRFTSTDPAYLGKLGTGYLADAARGLNAQTKGAGVDLTVVRVAPGTGATDALKRDATIANIIGAAGPQTGLWALRAAPAETKATPRLWGTPGFDTFQPDVNTPNAIVVELPAHLEAMNAIAVVDVAANSKEAAIAARELMSSDRIMPVGVGALVYETVNGVATLVSRPMGPRVLGRFVATDNNNEGKPFKPIARQPILGIAGTTRPINFSLRDGSTEGQLMLAGDVGVVVAGSTMDDAIADGGFYFVGVESAASGDLWSQIHQVRGADYLDRKAARITREFLGGAITPAYVEAWLQSLKFMLRPHVYAGDILGFELNFPKPINSVEDVRLGHLHYETKIEPTPVFRRATNVVRRYRPAVEALIDAIVARAGTASAVIS